MESIKNDYAKDINAVLSTMNVFAIDSIVVVMDSQMVRCYCRFDVSPMFVTQGNSRALSVFQIKLPWDGIAGRKPDKLPLMFGNDVIDVDLRMTFDQSYGSIEETWVQVGTESMATMVASTSNMNGRGVLTNTFRQRRFLLHGTEKDEFIDMATSIMRGAFKSISIQR